MDGGPRDSGSTRNNARRDFYERIGGLSMAPLWESLHQLVPPAPAPKYVAAAWAYDQVRPFLMESGTLITAKEAVRRVLILENPSMPGSACITPSLYAGLQLILPGEVAPSHRHTQSALRFIVEGDGAYTAVDGERTIMREGDFVITPTWTWHDHGNESSKPMVWLDGLDIPLVAMFNAGFAENGTEDEQEVAAPIGTSDAKFASGLLPVDWKPAKQTSPIFNYPYARTREALAGLAKAGAPDPCHGYKLRYVNPASGGAPIATMGTFMQLLPKGFETAPYRSTDGAVFSVVEGEGETAIGDKVFTWKKRDHFVVPSWARVVHRPRTEAVLFSFSDRPIQEKLDLWREDRGGNSQRPRGAGGSLRPGRSKASLLPLPNRESSC